MFNLKDLRKIRKQLGLTQSQLAQLSGVSQSLIAKVEAGKLDPTWSKAQAIFSALMHCMNSNKPKAKNIMTKKIIWLEKNESLRRAANLMQNHAISQIPIFEKGKAVGLVSEREIIDNLDNLNRAVGEVMQGAPPILNPEAPLEMLINLLRIYPILLIFDKGKPVGVITKSDLLKINLSQHQ